MTLYNAKSEGHSLRVTKFDFDLNPESSYLTTAENCECPAGVRSTCRHRQMYPHLQAIANTGKFFDFDNQLVINEHRIYGSAEDE